MNDKIPCDYLDEVWTIAVDAGRRILDVYEKDFSVKVKEDGSPLTEADHAAHELIVSRLSGLAPGLPILSEESVNIDMNERQDWKSFWLVDPLDGTKEFINRNGEFTVNIALIEGDRARLGVVYVPVKGLSYLACEGLGAFKQTSGGKREPIQVRPYAGGKATVAASRSHASDKLKSFLSRLAEREGKPELLSMGSAMKMCLVADGQADVYPRLGPTSEWDTAAAQCVVEAAGGRVTDINNQTLVYNKSSIINPWFVTSGAGKYDWTVFINE
jgi:3'(2'), 5'-bisphosphate nucleotidase